MFRRLAIFLLAALVSSIGQSGGAVSPEDQPPSGNRLLDDLVLRGVQIAGDEVIRLPRPTLSDGMSAAQQRAQVEAIPETHSDWNALTRRSAVAPFVLKIGAADGAPGTSGRQVDLWFVVYGDLDTLVSDDFVQTQFHSAGNDDAEDRPQAKLLTAADLTQRGIAAAKDRPARTTWPASSPCWTKSACAARRAA